MRRSPEEALSLSDHAEAVGGWFARQIPTGVVVGLVCVAAAVRVEHLARAHAVSVSLLPFFYPVLAFFFVLPALMTLLMVAYTKRPPARTRGDFSRVGYVTSVEYGIGGLWIGRDALHVVTGSAHATVPFSSIEGVLTDDPGSFATMLRWNRRAYPLVIRRTDGTELRLSVLAPVSMARSIRRAIERV